ncbi:hypothetical protein AMELA_G00047550 [Ameiurus melas]|uniref:ribonuclease H n=1 Tax=Ameiurus melas TaxID=219545 RepID=A0A7J6B8K6_AMEME|nr:hypothetical protein AMELA_G00047550 [Ameiurus melas]
MPPWTQIRTSVLWSTSGRTSSWWTNSRTCSPPPWEVVCHHIKTPLGVVVRQRPYRVPEARRKTIEEEVERMLRDGVIEESNSPWSSPIVVVPKPDGSIRLCKDFRRLNQVSDFDSYPLPRVDDLVERLGRARFISTLDLTKGYWQVALAADARPKTAFSTSTGQWQYRVLPFGLHGAPATFQRLMDIVLRPHRSFAVAYLDGVVIHSSTWSDHLFHLGEVLKGLRDAGLTANPKKCHLGLTEAQYLGYRIGRGMLQPQAEKVEAVKGYPRPTSKKNRCLTLPFLCPSDGFCSIQSLGKCPNVPHIKHVKLYLGELPPGLPCPLPFGFPLHSTPLPLPPGCCIHWGCTLTACNMPHTNLWRYWRSRSFQPLDGAQVLNLLQFQTTGTAAAPKAIQTSCTSILYYFTLSVVTQLRMGSLLSRVPLKISSFKHLREFFLATVATQWLAQLG